MEIQRLPVQPEGRSAALVIPLPTEGFGFAFGGQVLVHQPHRGRPVTDGRGNPLDRPVAGVSYRETPGTDVSSGRGARYKGQPDGCDPPGTTSRPVRM